MEQLIDFDKRCLVFLNGLGSEPYDGFWIFLTKQFHWTPFFILLLFFLQKKIGWKQLGIVAVFIALMIVFTDQVTNLFKFHFQRLRPCNDLEIKGVIRIVKDSNTYSFFSGHASNSTASMLFVFLILRKYYKCAFMVFLFPLIFAYSRIYLGLHFPLDILTGYFFGIFSGFLFYNLYTFLVFKYQLAK